MNPNHRLRGSRLKRNPCFVLQWRPQRHSAVATDGHNPVLVMLKASKVLRALEVFCCGLVCVQDAEALSPKGLGLDERSLGNVDPKH